MTPAELARVRRRLAHHDRKADADHGRRGEPEHGDLGGQQEAVE
jgi:hypothetical protein